MSQDWFGGVGEGWAVLYYFAVKSETLETYD
jgi:hypothetical protein